MRLRRRFRVIRCRPHLWVKTGFRVQSRKSSQDGYRETRRCSTCKQKSLGRWIHIKMPITEAAPAVESR